MHSRPSRADTRPKEGWDTLTAAACHWHPNTQASWAQGSAVPDGRHRQEQNSGIGVCLLQDANQGGHRKSSGHHFQLAHQGNWGVTAGFALSFTGMRLPQAKYWLVPPVVCRRCPNWTTDVASNMLRASLTPHTSSPPALTRGGTHEAAAAEHGPARCPTKEVSWGRDKPNRLKK